jgi:hypothetical protein
MLTAAACRFTGTGGGLAHPAPVVPPIDPACLKASGRVFDFCPDATAHPNTRRDPFDTFGVFEISDQIG